MIKTIQEWFTFKKKTPEIPREILIRLKADQDKIYKGHYYSATKTVEGAEGWFLVEDIAFWSYPVIPKEKTDRESYDGIVSQTNFSDDGRRYKTNGHLNPKVTLKTESYDRIKNIYPE